MQAPFSWFQQSKQDSGAYLMILNDISNEENNSEDQNTEKMIQEKIEQLVSKITTVIFNQANFTNQLKEKIEDSERKIMQEIQENKKEIFEKIKKLIDK